MSDIIRLLNNPELAFKSQVELVNLINNLILQNRSLYDKLPWEVQKYLGANIYGVKLIQQPSKPDLFGRNIFGQGHLNRDVNQLLLVLKEVVKTNKSLKGHIQAVEEDTKKKEADKINMIEDALSVSTVSLVPPVAPAAAALGGPAARRAAAAARGGVPGAAAALPVAPAAPAALPGAAPAALGAPVVLLAHDRAAAAAAAARGAPVAAARAAAPAALPGAAAARGGVPIDAAVPVRADAHLFPPLPHLLPAVLGAADGAPAAPPVAAAAAAAPVFVELQNSKDEYNTNITNLLNKELKKVYSLLDNAIEAIYRNKLFFKNDRNGMNELVASSKEEITWQHITNNIFDNDKNKIFTRLTSGTYLYQAKQNLLFYTQLLIIIIMHTFYINAQNVGDVNNLWDIRLKHFSTNSYTNTFSNVLMYMKSDKGILEKIKLLKSLPVGGLDLSSSADKIIMKNIVNNHYPGYIPLGAYFKLEGPKGNRYLILAGGGSKNYENKYLKYKSKYLKLKVKLKTQGLI
jgi:hypothetical protein